MTFTSVKQLIEFLQYLEDLAEIVHMRVMVETQKSSTLVEYKKPSPVVNTSEPVYNPLLGFGTERQ